MDDKKAFPNGNFQKGMTLRDWFAGQALAGMMASQWFGEFAERSIAEIEANNPTHEGSAARKAYQMADAMLSARKEN